MSCHVGAGKWAWVLWRALSALNCWAFSPPINIFILIQGEVSLFVRQTVWSFQRVRKHCQDICAAFRGWGQEKRHYSFRSTSGHSNFAQLKFLTPFLFLCEPRSPYAAQPDLKFIMQPSLVSRLLPYLFFLLNWLQATKQVRLLDGHSKREILYSVLFICSGFNLPG